MTRIAAFDDGQEFHLASNKGWGDFCRWVDELPVPDYKQIILLCEHGWVEGLEGLESQLQDAVKENAPDDEAVLSTVNDLLSILGQRKESDVVIVGDGTEEAEE